MLNAAERALADARLPGANRIGTYRPTTAITAEVEQSLGQLLRAALAAEDFQLLFQPMVSLQGGEE